MKQLFTRRSVSISLILLSAALGCLVHPFYDWTGADQSRPVALLWLVPMVIAIGLVLCCLALPWIPLQREVDTSNRRYQISLRTLMLLTTAISVLLATAFYSPTTFAVITMLATLFLVAYYWKQFPTDRWYLSALIAALYLPFAWAFFVDWHATGHWIEKLAMYASLPVLMPATLLPLGQWRASPEASAAIGTAVIGLEILAGLSCIRLGPRRGIVFVVLVLIVSMFSSLLLNAGFRA